MKIQLFQKAVLMIVLTLFVITNNYASELKLIKEKSLNVKSGETLFVEASGADVKVNSWDKEEAYVKIFANKKAEENMNFVIEKTGQGVKVVAKKRGSWFFSWGSGYSVKIEVTLPKNFDSDVETSGGDINVQNLSGNFELDTSGGDVDLKYTNGELKVNTSGGDITLDSHSGKTNVSTSGGDIVVKNLTGDLRASTSGGDINLDVKNGTVLARTSGGDIFINYDGLNKGIKASTSGGDIKLKLPSNFAANVELDTTGGGIDCDFKNSSTKKVKRGLLIADFNGGGEKIDCSTTGGDIVVSQK